MPSDSSVTVRKFFTCRLRSFSMAGSSVGPSTPQFQLRLSLRAVAVVFAVGLVVLAVVGDQIVEREAVVAGHEVDALLGLALLVAVDLRAADHAGRRTRRTEPGSPRKKSRTSSRNRPFHSFQVSPTKLPTWYSPAASHASAMSLVPASAGSDSMSHSTGGFGSGCPDASRDRIDARSKRKPSTCISCDPVAQAVHDHAADDRMVGVERVAAAGVVGVARSRPSSRM